MTKEQLMKEILILEQGKKIVEEKEHWDEDDRNYFVAVDHRLKQYNKELADILKEELKDED